MAKIISGIETSASEARQKQLQKNLEYNKENSYSSSHNKAKSINGQALGKGVANSDHQVYVPKIENKDDFKNRYEYNSLNTEQGGGDYDINGRNNNGGRERLLGINLYGKNHEYGNIDINVDIEGQYIVEE